MNKRGVRSWLAAIAGFAAAAMFPSMEAQGAVLKVTQCGDWGSGCLRHCVESAAPGDVVEFDPALDGAPITLLLGPIVIDRDLTIVGRGPDRTILDGNFAGGVLEVQNGTVVLKGLTIRNGRRELPGGGGLLVASDGVVILRESRLTGNWGDFYGGGIHNLGTLTVVGTTFTSNVSSRWGGAIHNDTGAQLTVLDSTFHRNEAPFSGGGLFNRGTAVVRNSTFADNWAWGYAAGVLTNGTLTMHSVTITGGWSYYGGTGLYARGSVTVENSIIADQVNGPNCIYFPTSLGHNLDDDGSCSFVHPTDLPNVEPRLSSLGDHGGPTWTQALAPTSPAIDAGICPETSFDPPGRLPPVTLPFSRDQRGVRRPVDGDGDGSKRCDIGAFEYDPRTDG